MRRREKVQPLFPQVLVEPVQRHRVVQDAPSASHWKLWLGIAILVVLLVAGAAVGGFIAGRESRPSEAELRQRVADGERQSSTQMALTRKLASQRQGFALVQQRNQLTKSFAVGLTNLKVLHVKRLRHEVARATAAAKKRGFKAGRKAGYSAGVQAGYESGKNDGYSAGRSAGYDSGYAAGQSDATSSSNYAPCGYDEYGNYVC